MKNLIFIGSAIVVILVGGFLTRTLLPVVVEEKPKPQKGVFDAIGAPAKEEAKPAPANDAAHSDQVSIRNGFVQAHEYASWSRGERVDYATGVVDGMLLAPVFDAPKPRTRWIEDCITGMNNFQIEVIVTKFVSDHPERLHYPMHGVIYSAMKDACSQFQP